MLVMRHTLIATALMICSALPAQAEVPRLKVGNTISWPVANPYNRDHFGCFDIENTKQAIKIYAQASMGAARSPSTNDTGPSAARTVEDFVQAHNYDVSTHKPNIFSNVCAPLLGGQKYKVASVFDWEGEQLVCLDITETFDPGPDHEASGPQPSCWWTTLQMPPPLSRR